MKNLMSIISHWATAFFLAAAVFIAWAEYPAGASAQENAALDKLAAHISGRLVFSQGDRTQPGGWIVRTMNIGDWRSSDLGPGRFARWSPDGTKIAVWQEDDVAKPSTPFDIEGATISWYLLGSVYVMDADGSNRKKLVSNVMSVDFRWGCPIEFNSNNQEILYTPACHDGTWKGLWAVDIITGDTRRIRLPLRYITTEMQITPDGRFLVTRNKEPGIGGIVWIDLENQIYTKYNSNSKGNCMAMISPDAQWVTENERTHNLARIINRMGTAPAVTIGVADFAGMEARWDAGHWSNHNNYFTIRGDDKEWRMFIMKFSGSKETMECTKVNFSGEHCEYPDLYVILDETGPTKIGGLNGAADQNIVTLSWTAATDAETGIKSYAVYRDDILIGQTSALSFIDKSATELHRYTYTVKATNGAGLQGPLSEPVAVETGADKTPPHLLRARAPARGTEIILYFDEALNKAAAENIAHYAISDGITISKAFLSENAMEVTLWTTSLKEGKTYTVTVNAVTDCASMPNTISANTSVQCTYTPFISGLIYQNYSGKAETVSDISALQPSTSGITPSFALTSTGSAFATIYSGLICIETGGLYTFFVSSDDGSQLRIDNEPVVSNDGIHPMSEKSGSVSLDAGMHTIALAYFQGGGQAGLEMRWEGPGIQKELLPDTILFHTFDASQNTSLANISLLSPKPDALLQLGQTIQIAWEGDTGAISQLAIHFSIDGGMTWHAISENTIYNNDPEWGDYAWTIPTEIIGQNGTALSTVSNQCLIKLAPYNNEFDECVMEGYFSIVRDPLIVPINANQHVGSFSLRFLQQHMMAINTPFSGNHEVSIVRADGRLVMRKAFNGGSGMYPFSIAILPSGLYIIKARSGVRETMRTVAIEK